MNESIKKNLALSKKLEVSKAYPGTDLFPIGSQIARHARDGAMVRIHKKYIHDTFLPYNIEYDIQYHGESTIHRCHHTWLENIRIKEWPIKNI